MLNNFITFSNIQFNRFNRLNLGIYENKPSIKFFKTVSAQINGPFKKFNTPLCHV